MVATLTKGTTYAPGGTVNDTNLDALLTSASINNIDRANLQQADTGVVTISDTTPPGWYALECFAHSDQPTCWVTNVSGSPAPVFPNHRQVIVTSGSTNVVPGNLVQPDGFTGSPPVLNVKLAETRRMVIGVMGTVTNAGSTGVMIMHGICQIKSTGTIQGGRNLRLSSTNGVCEAMTVDTSGTEKFGNALRDASGDFVWAVIQR